MKIKILFAPSLIILTIVMIIWYLYPAYTNGIDGVREERGRLKQQEQLMENLDSRIGNVGKLVTELNVNSSDNAVIYGYIPKDKEVENIIESLNSLANDSTLSVVNISALDEKTSDAPAVDNSTVISNNNPFPGTNPSTPSQAPVTPKAVPKKIKVNLSVAGDYANIKILLEKIQKLKRFNSLMNLEVKTLINEDGSLSSSLQANITLEFSYLNELKRLADGDIDNAVFSSGVFDKAIIDQIRSSRNIDVNNVLPGEKGGNNPFIIAK